MNEISIPYKKGQKFLLEIEAKNDGDFIGSELLSKLFSKKDIQEFEFNSLIIKLDGYKNDIKKEIVIELINYFVEKGLIEKDSFPNGIF
jgi:hypothetical protein